MIKLDNGANTGGFYRLVIGFLLFHGNRVSKPRLCENPLQYIAECSLVGVLHKGDVGFKYKSLHIYQLGSVVIQIGANEYKMSAN